MNSLDKLQRAALTDYSATLKQIADLATACDALSREMEILRAQANQGGIHVSISPDERESAHCILIGMGLEPKTPFEDFRSYDINGSTLYVTWRPVP